MPARVAPQLLAGGIALGLGWRWLLETVPGQLGVALAFGLLFIALAILHRQGLLHLPSEDVAHLAIPATVLLPAIIWRDSETLTVLNIGALMVLVAMARPVRVPTTDMLGGTGLLDLFRQGLHMAGGVALGAVPLAHAARPITSSGRKQRWLAAGVGVLAISPALVVFSLLLSSADPAFDRLMAQAFSVELEPVAEQLIPALILSWIGAGLLYSLTRPPLATPARQTGGWVSSATISGALLPIALLFGVFLLLQSRYLFGGRAVVLATADLSFAEYARQGFFELVAVAAATLPILLIADWASDRDVESRRRFTRLARVLLALLAGLLVSALLRMLIYTDTYGLTESRLFTTAFMLWLAFVLAWFGSTVLRGHRARFVDGSVTAAFATLIMLNVVGPTSLIVQVNAWRAQAGQPFDARYVASLDAGVVTALDDVADWIPLASRCELVASLQERWRDTRSQGGNWNIERWRARPQGEALSRLAGHPCAPDPRS